MPSPHHHPRPVVLCVLDGWGYREDKENNAIAQARTPYFDALWNKWPHALLDTSGEDVGLPPGQMGNSEVGHMNLGAGRIVYQDLPMIDRAVASKELDKNPALLTFINTLKKSKGTAHVMGLLSPGGVHSHQSHMAALVRILSAAGVPVAVHAFLDGRDVPPSSAREYVQQFQKDIASTKAPIATVSGRFYAMDRDKRWDRVEKAYQALVMATGDKAPTAGDSITQSYSKTVTDEFVLPTVIGGYAGMKDGDGILMANFRTDRAREILLALLDPTFKDFPRTKTVKFAAALGMVEYSERHSQLMATLFPPKAITNHLGEIMAQKGLKQLRIAETEKYPHVTFFFNGGQEKPYPGEERILVNSPKVATYDQQPEMSAFELTDKLVEAVNSGAFDFIVLNYANPDMVGHTGDLNASIKAIEALDTCLGRLWAALEKQGGALLITADHGNCENMYDHDADQPHTAHTLNPVPVILANGPAHITLRNGRLADVAPTLLQVMGFAVPAEMTGQSLIVSTMKKARHAG